MKISITARHCEVSSGIRTFAEQRLEKLHKFAPDIHGIHVVVSQEKNRFLAEISIRINGHDFVSTQNALDAGAAVEKAIDRAEEQLRRHKDRRITTSQRAPRAAERAAAAPADAAEDED